MATDTGEGYGVPSTDPSSGVTLAQLKVIISYLGWRDTSTNGAAAKIRFLNQVVWTIASLVPWPEFLKRDGSQAIVSGTDEYTLSETGIDKLGIVTRSDNTLPLDECSLEEWKADKVSLAYTGTPSRYAVDKTVASGVTSIKMLLFPNPTASDTLYYSYYRKPVEMVNDSDICDFPESRMWLVENALEYIMAGSDKATHSVFSLHDPQFMQKVYSAMGDARGSYLPIKTKPARAKTNNRIRDNYWQVTS